MTQAVETMAVGRPGHDVKIIALISTAHFVSHFYMIVLPPLFILLKDDFGVSYTALGLGLTLFNVVSAGLQTPAGFLVDRLGPRSPLIGGLLLGGVALVICGLLPNYWIFLAMFCLLGLANTVYHPADYTILSTAVAPKRMGQAFSIHTFFGYLGGGVAPTVLLLSAAVWGWRGAFVVAGLLGVVAAILLAAQGQVLTLPGRHAEAVPSKTSHPVGWRLLLSAPILRNLAFFSMTAMAFSGLQGFLVVALGALYDTPLATANIGLSAFLLLGSLGVLAGGVLADRTSSHNLVAALFFAIAAGLVLLIGMVDLAPLLLLAALALIGFCNGVTAPSRDMMVRAATPPGSFGKVFGFVSTGFNIGGALSPLLFGWLMDLGRPQWIFFTATGFALLSILTVVGASPRTRASTETA